MKVQHQVTLAIGSNQGNRLENIEQCLQLIHQEVGTVVRVSSLYESPSWGFESDAFYNCAVLIHTFSEAEVVLNQILELEKTLGRVRLNLEG